MISSVSTSARTSNTSAANASGDPNAAENADNPLIGYSTVINTTHMVSNSVYHSIGNASEASKYNVALGMGILQESLASLTTIISTLEDNASNPLVNRKLQGQLDVFKGLQNLVMLKMRNLLGEKVSNRELKALLRSDLQIGSDKVALLLGSSNPVATSQGLEIRDSNDPLPEKGTMGLIDYAVQVDKRRKAEATEKSAAQSRTRIDSLIAQALSSLDNFKNTSAIDGDKAGQALKFLSLAEGVASSRAPGDLDDFDFGAMLDRNGIQSTITSVREAVK